MSRTIALTPFFNELDVLEIRLAELDPVVDVHVIAEASVTYAGNPKPLLLQENWDRFERWRDKIRYVPVENMPNGGEVRGEPDRPTTACDSDRWARENYQREALIAGLHDVKDDDLLFLSDLDEIPHPDAFQQGGVMAQTQGMIARPRLAMYVYRMRWRWQQPLPVIARFFTPATLHLHGDNLEQVRLQEGTPWGPEWGAGLGWHLAYMGGVEAVQYKLAEAAHHELDTPAFNNEHHIQHSIDTGADLFDRDDRHAVYTPPGEMPPYVTVNRERFKHLI